MKRRTQQFLLPLRKPPARDGSYDIYPVFHLGKAKMKHGFESLAEAVSGLKTVCIDGYSGVFFDEFREEMDAYLSRKGLRVAWTDISHAMKPASQVHSLKAPFLGGDDPLFGTRTHLELADLFDRRRLKELQPDPHADLNIIYGCGAALAGWDAMLVYVDLPKNEQQYRARAGVISCLGDDAVWTPKEMYKHSYFFDWIVLNIHKKSILPGIGIFVDGQRPGEPAWTEGDTLRRGLHLMSRNCFRARPWFEPGAWGGQWIKSNIPGINTETANYAWSFELITPENGLIFESDGIMMEVSFDMLMFQEASAVLGESYRLYHDEFPLRFDFLDTVRGGNLSIQCHPDLDYIRRHFGENFTQEEAYYIMDAAENAKVNLGFREDIEPAVFRETLEKSAKSKTPVNIEMYVMQFPSHRHDFFLIPPGTIHGSGVNNLVLEISTTPYIFTFKMYDWLRPDLDGNPRDLNIERAFENLCVGLKGRDASRELLSLPVPADAGSDWQLFHLPTHEHHAYVVYRYHFKTEIRICTNNKFLVMNLVEGESVKVTTKNKRTCRFSYAETFVIPAAAEEIIIMNESKTDAMLVVAMMKDQGKKNTISKAPI